MRHRLTMLETILIIWLTLTAGGAIAATALLFHGRGNPIDLVVLIALCAAFFLGRHIVFGRVGSQLTQVDGPQFALVAAAFGVAAGVVAIVAWRGGPVDLVALVAYLVAYFGSRHVIYGGYDQDLADQETSGE